jgi:histidinol-phosphatase (PHP family)
LVDYHLHTHFSDGRGNHAEYVEWAERQGIFEIGFADHVCINPIPWAVPLEKLPEMIQEIDRARKKSGPEFTIRAGIEMDYFPDREDEIDSIIKALPLDYVIGSVHFLNKWNFESTLDGYDEWDMNNLYEFYFNLIIKATRSGLFDIIAHVDLIKKFGHRPNDGIGDLYREVARTFRESDVVVELNTSGLNKPCKEFFPSESFLKIFYDEGVHITLGSDAHNPENVGQHFEMAHEMLKSVGYSEIAVFKERERTYISL